MRVELEHGRSGARSPQADLPRPARPPRPADRGLGASSAGAVSRREWRWCLGAAAAVMVLTCLPYWWLGRVTPAGLRFLGFFVGLDDQCVYLAWMKQAAEGHFFFRSLW